MPEDDDEYRRGHLAGEIAARLAQHDQHFAAINGSIGDLRDEMHALTLAMQRLGDAMISDRATVLTTAAALKDAEAARRDRSDQGWSPLARLIAVGAATATAIGTYLLLRSH